MAFTFFFRDRQTLDNAVDATLENAANRRAIRVWDAGCAMGMETYTIAILFAEKMSHFAFKKVYIDATDIDESGHFGETIESGYYPVENCKRIPAPLVEKYFSKIEGNGHYVVDSMLRSRIEYQRNDLRDCTPPRTGYDLIVCKNVLLHLAPQQRLDVWKMFHSVLQPNGILAMEQTQALPNELDAFFSLVSHNDKIYRKLAEA